MNESVLRALLRLFALITQNTDDSTRPLAIGQVKAYLQHKIDASLIPTYLSIFEEDLQTFSRPPKKDGKNSAKKASTLGSVKVIMACEKINENLAHYEKITVLIRLSEFVHKGGQISFRESNFLETLARIFNIEVTIFELIQHFVFNEEVNHPSLIYAGAGNDTGNWFIRDDLPGKIIALLLPGSSQTFVKYTGLEKLRINQLQMVPQTIYVFNEGGVITGKKSAPVYHSDLQLIYYQPHFEQNIILRAENITFVFPGGNIGLHPFNLEQHSGKMVGIMGASGAGKSTLLNILNGNLTPDSGRLSINGIPVHNKKAKQLIGYVPQDDLLIEELTVFENLYYNGLLCLPGLSEKELRSRIDGLLHRIDLYEISGLRVGSVLDKRISGGQRKRLNIALELLREPAVLFVDEPTSGLSSQDSELVMRWLKQLTLKGQLIFTVIHQPSGHIYRLLDHLILLDKGGYPVYSGRAMEAPAWFRKKAGYVSRPGEEQAFEPHVDPDEMLRIIEARQVNEFGQIISDRVKSPQQWYDLFKAEQEDTASAVAIVQPVESPAERYQVPSRWTQFKVYLKRNLLSKIRNRSFLIIALLEAPVLAIIIGFFTRYAAGTEQNPEAYLLYYNKNLPAFLFMIIVVALFVGMQISAEEIIRDRKILKRESFLNLSWLSYLNSKVVYLMSLSAIQTILLVFIGNLMLGIDGMYGYFFAILFPTFVFANLVGLNISMAFSSVVTIYILVPFLVVPQLLLSGVIVDFDTLQDPKKQGKTTPVIADIMVARWAYEAMAVAQFKHNDYQRHFFDTEQTKHEALYQFSFRIPELNNLNDQCLRWISDSTGTPWLNNSLHLLQTEVEKTNQLFALKFDRVSEIHPQHYTPLTAGLLTAWLNEMERQYRRIWRNADDKINEISEALAAQLDLEDLLPLKEAYHNKKLEEHLKNDHELQKIRVVDDVLIRKTDYIYKIPESYWGRAHFYAPVKFVGNKTLDTEQFNVLVIWLFNVVLYVALYFRIFEKRQR